MNTFHLVRNLNYSHIQTVAFLAHTGQLEQVGYIRNLRRQDHNHKQSHFQEVRILRWEYIVRLRNIQLVVVLLADMLFLVRDIRIHHLHFRWERSHIQEFLGQSYKLHLGCNLRLSHTQLLVALNTSCVKNKLHRLDWATQRMLLENAHILQCLDSLRPWCTHQREGLTQTLRMSNS